MKLHLSPFLIAVLAMALCLTFQLKAFAAEDDADILFLISGVLASIQKPTEPAVGVATYPIVDTNQESCYGNGSELISCPAAGQAFHGQGDPSYVGTGGQR